MALRGGQARNSNAESKRPFWAAVCRVLATRSGSRKIEALDEIAERLVNAALAGEQWALKEVADRLDGKALQQIQAEVSAEVSVVEIQRFSEKKK